MALNCCPLTIDDTAFVTATFRPLRFMDLKVMDFSIHYLIMKLFIIEKRRQDIQESAVLIKKYPKVQNS